MTVHFRAIKPKQWKTKYIWLSIASMANSVAKDIEKDLKEITKTWDHKPEFEALKEISQTGTTVMVLTDDSVFNMLDAGIKEHDIFPKEDGGVLAFPWDGYGSYIPKTEPGWIGSRKSKVGVTKNIRAYVHHPGVDARKFYDAVAERWQKRFNDRCNKAIKNGLDKAQS